MTDTLRRATARKQTIAELEGPWFDGGKLDFYTAPVPDDADEAISTQTLLVSVPLDDPAGSATDGVWTSSPLDAVMVAASGDAAFVRAYDEFDTVIGDLDVGAIGSGAAIEIDDVSLTAGGYLLVSSFTLTE
jgi:hypothetical protein